LWLARAAVVIVVTAAALKLGDLALGRAANTFERHLLRLPPHVSVRHRSNEFDYEFRTNALGLRGDDVPLDKPAGARRIVVLGDSFVAGWGVDAREIFSAQLEERLNKSSADRVQVINAGRVGSGPTRQCDIYEAVGRRFHPDLVVLAFYLGNDLLDAAQEQDRDELARWHPDGIARRALYAWCPNAYLELAILRQAVDARRQFEPRTSAEVQQTITEQARASGANTETALERYQALPADVRQELEQGLLSQHRVLPACYDPDRIRRALDPNDDELQSIWPRAERALERLKLAVAADGARLAIMIIPDAAQVDPLALAFDAQFGYHVNREWLHRQCRTQQQLHNWATENGIASLDLTDALRASAEQCYFTRDQHFTPAGHAVAAEQLAAWLRSAGL
jgi:lysophospholipase L1-like esterase